MICKCLRHQVQDHIRCWMVRQNMGNISSLSSVIHVLLYSIQPTRNVFVRTVILLRTIETKAPGPGHYSIYCSIDGSGTYNLSKYRSVLCRSFGGQTKPELDKPLNTPGPGTYQVPSEFGIYKAQDKYIRESQRIDKMRMVNTALGVHLKRKIADDNGEGESTTSGKKGNSFSIDLKG